MERTKENTDWNIRSMKKVAIFDGTNMLFRAFFAVPLLHTRDGQATNAVYGALKSFRGIVQDLQPDYIIVCWDNGKKTFRHAQDPTYKAHRPPVNPDLKAQFSIFQDGLSRLKAPQIIAPDGVECDDIIGAVAIKSAEHFDTIIISSDKDFYQLCTHENISVYSPTVKKANGIGLVDADYIITNYGVTPKQLVDVKSLTGEKTDNIQGVNGIGPKTATALIQKHGSIHKALIHMQKNPQDRLAPKLMDAIDIIENAYKLALIRTDIDIPEIPIKLVGKTRIDAQELMDFFKFYELESMNKELSSWTNLYSYATITK